MQFGLAFSIVMVAVPRHASVSVPVGSAASAIDRLSVCDPEPWAQSAPALRGLKARPRAGKPADESPGHGDRDCQEREGRREGNARRFGRLNGIVKRPHHGHARAIADLLHRAHDAAAGTRVRLRNLGEHQSVERRHHHGLSDPEHDQEHATPGSHCDLTEALTRGEESELTTGVKLCERTFQSRWSTMVRFALPGERARLERGLV